jgi:phosphohistidine swiveling domain-containing protein
MTNNWLLTLDEINVDDLNLVGGKALTLAALKRNHLETPPGLVITSAFFEAQIKHYAYIPIWAGSPDVAVTETSLEFLADFLKTTPLAHKLDVAFKAKLKQVFPSEVQSFAVRSSAIDEDLSEHSFAGAYLTELGVPRDLLTVSLTRCWASALSGRSIQYRLKRGMSIQRIKIAVLIQPLLRPDTAGVGFTLNPVTGARDELVIEASSGLGDKVVNSTINPYRYHLVRQSANYSILKKIPSDTVNLTREPLSTKQLIKLAKTLEQVEAMLGTPQDVEWAYQDGTLYILQTRPITTILETQSGFFDSEWTRANHPEILPEIPSPLFISLMKRTQDRGLVFFTQIGLDVLGLGPYLKDIYGRPYLNLSIVKRVLTQLGFNPISLLAMIGYVEAEPKAANPFRVDWGAVWRARKPFLKLFAKIFQMGKTVKTYRETVRHIIKQLQEPSTSPGDALRQFKLREQVYGELIGTGLVLVSALTGSMITIAKIISPLVTSSGTLISSLGKIDVNSVAAYHNLMLLTLGQEAVKEKRVFEYLTRNDNIFTDYQTALAETQFLTKFNNYLAERGDRATYEPDVSWPRFREQTGKLLRTISQYAKLAAEGSLDESQVRSKRPPAQIWRELINSARGIDRWVPWRRIVAYPLVLLLRRLFALRSDMLTAEAKGIAAIRSWDLALATKWVQAGYLEVVDDYFWLTMEEIERALVAENDAGIYLKSAAAAKKDTYRTYAGIQVPIAIKDSEIPHLYPGNDYPQELLSGTLMGLPVSPGQVQGIVKILEETDSLDQIPEGSILVAPSTDPALLPFFPLAVGLIVEVGGMLSHGSIIAREYGVPAVSSVVDARKRLKSGDRVLLDGSTGVVQILESAP